MEPTLAEVIIFAGNFAPRGWAFCEGQILPINQNQALFSLLGTTYGGDGRTSFGLPDCRSRSVIGAGSGASTGLSNYDLGQRGGQETVTLNSTQIPPHTHTGAGNPVVSDGAQNQTDAKDHVFGLEEVAVYTADTSNLGDMADDVGITLANTGGNQGHNNIMPYQAVHYIIALQGVFPSRS